MPLHPQAQQVIDAIRDLRLPPAHTVSPQEARENARQHQRTLNASRQITEVGNVENRIIDGPGGPLPIRIYTPTEPGPYPILVWFHGGGWVIGALELWATAGRAHLNRDFTFGSQALAVAFTESETLGGRVWPNIGFAAPALTAPLRFGATVLWGCWHTGGTPAASSPARPV